WTWCFSFFVGECSGSLPVIDTQRASTERHHVQHAAHDGEVLHEIDLLHLLLRGFHRPERVKDQGRRNQVQEDRGRRPARLPADDEQDAADQFDDGGAARAQLWQRQSLARDIAYRAFESGDLSKTRDDEDQRQQYAPDERAVNSCRLTQCVHTASFRMWIASLPPKFSVSPPAAIQPSRPPSSGRTRR